jgi:hypothetical protein
MVLTIENPDFTDENGEHPGLYTAYNANPKSAKYHPGNYNRFARYLRSIGEDAPDEVPIESRRLRDRNAVIRRLLGE